MAKYISEIGMFFSKAATNIYNLFEEELNKKLEQKKEEVDSLLDPRVNKRMSISEAGPEIKKGKEDLASKTGKKSIKRSKDKKEDSEGESDSDSDEIADSEYESEPNISRQSTFETLEELKQNLITLNAGKIDKNAEKELADLIELRRKLNDPKNKDNQKNIEKEIIQIVQNSNSLPPSREQSPVNSPREKEHKIEHKSEISSPKFKTSNSASTKFGSIKGTIKKFKDKNTGSVTSSREQSPVNSPREEEHKSEYKSEIFSPKFKASNSASTKFGSIKGTIKKFKDKNTGSVPSSREQSPVNSPREEESEVEHESKSKSKIFHSESNKPGRTKDTTKQKAKDLNSLSPFREQLAKEENNFKESEDKIEKSVKPPKLIKFSKKDYMSSVIQPGMGNKFGQANPKKVEEDRENTLNYGDIDPNTEPPQVMIIEFENLKEKATITDMGTDKKINIESEDEYSDNIFNEEHQSECLASVIKPMEKINDQEHVIDGSEIRQILGDNGSLIISKADIH